MSRHKWIIGGVGLLILAAVAVWAAQSQPASTQQQPAAAKAPAPQPAGARPALPPTLVAVAEVIQQQVGEEQTFVGTVMPKRISSIGSAVDGRVVDYPMNEGDRVNKGDTLAQLLTGQLEIQLAGAKAELQLRKHALEELRTSWPEEVKQAEARYLARKAASEYAGVKHKRAKSLHQTGAVSDELLQETESIADQASQTFNEAKSAWEVTQGPRKLSIDQAEQKVAVQEEEVNAIQDQINKHTIRSPFDGYVVQEFTEVGEWVAKAGLVAKVAELDEVDIEIMVVENYLPSLAVGAPASIEVPALKGTGGEYKFKGQVALIVPQADSRSRSFPVKVRMQNRKLADGQLLLKAGMLARVTARVGTQADMVLVPKDAIVLGGQSPLVFVVDEPPTGQNSAVAGRQGVARSVPVELGVEQNNLIQVKGNVKPQERVVVQGNERLRPGMLVIVAEAKAISR